MTRFFAILSLLCLSLLTGCIMSNTLVHVTQKPLVALPEHIKSVAIIDRTQVERKNKLRNALEGMMSGERLGQDKQGEQAVVAGLGSILQTSELQSHITSIRLVGVSRPGSFPPPLDSFSVNNICRDFNSDAVASLEAYDSNCSSRWVTIKFGFRLYDRQSKHIIDQYYDAYTIRRRHIYSYSYRNRNQNYAIISHASFDAGTNYGRRIAATNITVSRKYFSKGNAQMNIAGRKAKLGSWQDAADIWQQVAQSGDKKNAGRAAYNLALVSEINGDLPQALAWISKSYGDYNNSKARSYGEVINDRLIHMQGIKPAGK